MPSVLAVTYDDSDLEFEDVSDEIEAAVSFYLSSPQIDRVSAETPSAAFDPERGQVDAKGLLSDLSDRPEVKEADITVGLTDKDVFYGDNNFVFGLAHSSKRRAIISTFRLKRDRVLRPVQKEVFVERVFKEVLHELGHIFGLHHCSNKSCAMSFSSTIKEVDDKLPRLCESCLGKLKASRK